jgi:hypothetical protein
VYALFFKLAFPQLCIYSNFCFAFLFTPFVQKAQAVRKNKNLTVVDVSQSCLLTFNS